MKKYEYKAVFKFKGLEEELNKLGKEGWDVVTACTTSALGSTANIAVILKREL